MVTSAILACLLLATVSAADRQDDDLQRRLGLLEQRYASDMRKMEERVVTLETANLQLTTENEVIKARLESLENEVEQCKHKLNDGKEDESETVGETENTDLVDSTRNGTLARQNTDGPDGTLKQPKTNHKRALVEATNIAFTAYVDHDLDNQGADQILIFNKVLLNHGNAYNNITGAFTAPVAGVYSFSFFIGERDAHQFWATLMVNNQHMLDAVSEAAHTYQDIQGGNTANLQLSQGDVVSIRHLRNIGTHVESDPGRRITTFSGFLIYPVEDPSTIVGK